MIPGILLFWREYIRVFAVSPSVFVIYLVVYTIAGMAIGVLTGWLASLVTKSGPKRILKDAFLGSIGFLAGFIGCLFVPTVVEKLSSGGTVTTAMSRYQHPELVAITIAVLLPVLHEVYRFTRARTVAT
jgi:hypothetical protein